MKEYILYGGSFDPPHLGHLFALSSAISSHDYAPLIIPAFQHPYQKKLSNFNHRMEMCRLAFGWLPEAEVWDIERTLYDCNKQTYAYDVAEYCLTHILAPCKLHLLVGSDTYQDLPNWTKYDELMKILTPVVVQRVPGISSTIIREDFEKNSNLVLPVVAEYIREHQLYE